MPPPHPPLHTTPTPTHSTHLYRQLDVCRELEEERESCVREIKSLQSQVEAQRKSLEAQNTLLTDKVCDV